MAGQIVLQPNTVAPGLQLLAVTSHAAVLTQGSDVQIQPTVFLPDTTQNKQQDSSPTKNKSEKTHKMPRRPRAKITDDKKEEILQFCDQHRLLRQGEVADIFGIDRTTVTKLLKRFRNEPVSYNPVPLKRQKMAVQFDFEDSFYRTIMNIRSESGREWTDEQLFKHALYLHKAKEISPQVFIPTKSWLQDFKQCFHVTPTRIRKFM